MTKRRKADWVEKIETELRGKYLSIAVDAEWMLIIVIHECLKPNIEDVKNYYKFKNGRKKDINDLTLDEKIELSNILVQQKHPTIYKNHKRIFNTINRLRSYRNKFAHCKIDTVFSKQDNTEITLHTLLKGFKVKSKPYKIKSLKAGLRRYHKRLTETLVLLTKVLKVTYPSALPHP